ncbi:MAG: Flp pilus assembly complex ATPase component TadA [Planctomycetes bacterium]|nr:Flp pilus assembly complex ATPase component TadA [Planctomycetota bacterium]
MGFETHGLISTNLVPLLADSLTLVSWWKPFLFLLPFLAWAWAVSTVCDKHAARFYLEREMWNYIHCAAALLAILAIIFMPSIGENGMLSWLASFVAVCLILSMSVVAYVVVANKDERVPEAGRVSFELSKLTSFAEGTGKKKAKGKAGTSVLTFRRMDKSAVEPPATDSPEFETRLAAEAMLIKALDIRSSRIEIGPSSKDAFQIVFNVDGIKTPGDTMPAASGVKLIDFWKGVAKLDVADRRKKQSADITVERGSGKNKLHLETAGGQSGQKLTLLIDPEQQVRKTAEQIGWTPEQTEIVRGWSTSRGGTVLLSAGPEGGRTTTLYTVMKMHDAYTNNVQTVELDLEDALEGIRQNKWDAMAEGPDFATLVRSILRRDPDIVGVADIPDPQTAKEITKADPDKCRVYASLPADSAVAAIQAWVRLLGDAEAAAKSVHGVMSQKLIRKLCINCKQAYQPSPDVLKKLGLPPDKVKQLFRKGGEVMVKNKPETCPVCQGTGYLQRDGAFEVFNVDDSAREMIRSQNWAGLKTELRKAGLPSIQQAALRKAIDGVTSVEEVLRITAEQPAKAPASANQPPKQPQPVKPKN